MEKTGRGLNMNSTTYQKESSCIRPILSELRSGPKLQGRCQTVTMLFLRRKFSTYFENESKNCLDFDFTVQEIAEALVFISNSTKSSFSLTLCLLYK